MTTSHNLKFPYRPTEQHVASLSDDFLNALITEIDTDDIAGITLAGSHIRGEATPYSDVDHGSVTALMQDIANFRWETLQESANFFASDWLMLLTEMAHKILSELAKENDLSIAYASEKLLSHLTEVVAVQRGVMIKTDSTYYLQVEEAAEMDSNWTKYHRQGAGVDIPSNMHSVKARGIASLHLYRETVNLLWDILVPEHRGVIEQTLAIIGDI